VRTRRLPSSAQSNRCSAAPRLSPVCPRARLSWTTASRAWIAPVATPLQMSLKRVRGVRADRAEAFEIGDVALNVLLAAVLDLDYRADPLDVVSHRSPL
jgi:hypothetical protein